MKKTLRALGKVCLVPYYGSLASSLVVIALFLTGMVRFAGFPFSDFSLQYFVLSAALPMISGSLATLNSRNRLPIINLNESNELCYSKNDLTLIFGLLGFLGCIFGLINIYLQGRLSGDLVVLRSNVFEGVESSGFSYLSNALVPFGLFCIAICVVYYEEISPAILLVGLIGSFVGQVCYGFFMAGRYIVIAQLILAFWFALHRPMFGRPVIPRGLFLKVALIILAATVIFGSAFITINRSVKEDQAAFALELSKDMIQVSEPVVELMQQLPPGLAALLAEGCLYWTTSIVTFDVGYCYWHHDPSVLGAMAPFLRRRLSGVGLALSEADEVKEWINICAGRDIYSGTWATVPFDML